MSVLILDFGSQFTQLIARRVREHKVYCEIKPCTEAPDKGEFEAIILSGGPASVTDPDSPQFDTDWFSLGLPILGVCYGMQLMAHHLGGELSKGENREYGQSFIDLVGESPLFHGVPSSRVWMSHGDHIKSLPKGFNTIAKSVGAPIAAMACPEKKMFAVQFHPEVVHTQFGREILGNFLFRISQCKPVWTAGNFIEETVERLKREVPADAHAICALSGGVDSTVAATLVSKALGKRLHCIFVDNGLLRKDEGDKVEKAVSDIGLQVTRVNAQDRFLSALKGITDPEEKRKIIGRVFIEVFDEETKRIPEAQYLVQGTLYPDVIESVSVRGPSATIKTHHNVGGLPPDMKLKLIEPLRELFKDEVRVIGRELEVPAHILERQPFPGPGLAIRILGEVTDERLRILKDVDAIFLEEIRAAGLYRNLWQSFAVLLPIQSVGVMGDGRTYEMTAALRAVTSEDGMTADWVYLPDELLRTASNRIINEVKGVNRVVLDISSKPPATIEWE